MSGRPNKTSSEHFKVVYFQLEFTTKEKFV